MVIRDFNHIIVWIVTSHTNSLVCYSVATLLLWKSTKFHDKKTLDSQKNNRLQTID